MERKLLTERGRGLYRRPRQIVKRVFGQRKVTKSADRFTGGVDHAVMASSSSGAPGGASPF
jgi:hypothetical protein